MAVWARRRSRADRLDERRLLEPFGILSGPSALEAIKAKVALPLAGGPLAFSRIRSTRGGARAVDPSDPELAALAAPRPPWAGLPHGPAVMGIINVTPDSFSDGGATVSHSSAIEAGRRMWAEGAAILDIGGESTRPGATPVPPEEEQRRILPVIEALSRDGTRISVDTRNASTMLHALDAGAVIVNDVSALQHDPQSLRVVSDRGCPVILMHMRGTPQTMTSLAQYGDVAAEVVGELADRIELCVSAGVVRDRIAVDPGFGFAKTSLQSRELLRRLPLFFNLFCPIIAGMSRKRFIGEMAGSSPVHERDGASVAAGLIALSLGATVLRVHDVTATVQAVRVWQAMQAAPDAKGEFMG